MAGRLKALYNRHQLLAEELERRGYRHAFDLDKKLAIGSAKQSVFIDTIEEQEELLRAKLCECLLD